MKDKIIRMWLARDEGIYLDDMDDTPQVGKLHLFYDTPLVHTNSETKNLRFDCARIICEVPSYMYPDIEEGDCVELNNCGKKYRYKNFSRVE